MINQLQVDSEYPDGKLSAFIGTLRRPPHFGHGQPTYRIVGFPISRRSNPICPACIISWSGQK